MIEVNKGVLVIGLSNTILFGGESTVELIMLNVSTGQDFSLPLTEEQAELLLSQVSVEEMLNTEPEEEPSYESVSATSANSVRVGTDSDKMRAELNNIIGVQDPGAVVDAWQASEETPQL
tara:strand:+ start:42819 stop:43178 length:360 start_codon:yes stop_codon:yes gene_type:complete